MKKEIKKLRIRIDGLAQLVESLSMPTIIVDKNKLPEDITAEEFAKMYRESPMPIIQRFDAKVISTPFLHNIYECHRSLLLSKAWLGKILGELGEETPYKSDGKRKTVEDIANPADVAIETEDFPVSPEKWDDKTNFDEVSYIEKIDFLREEIKNLTSQSYGLYYRNSHLMGSWAIFNSSTNVYQHLSEARFHLGFELQRIKEGLS
jgi:hypothetical protein